MTELSIDEPSCRKNLQSLSTPKFRILQRVTAGAEQQNEEVDPDSQMVIDTSMPASSQATER